MESIIVIDSSDEEGKDSNSQKRQKKLKRAADNVTLVPDTPQRKRICPTTISNKVSDNIASFGEDDIEKVGIPKEIEILKITPLKNNTEGNVTRKTPINKTFQELLDECRKADSTPDMDLLINKKLIRYYEKVHPDFVNSKSFAKNVQSVIQEIRKRPDLVYLKLANILEELNIRRKSNEIVVTNEEITSTGSKKKDEQIERLNKFLYILKKKIAKLELAEVDFEDDNNSAYTRVERYKVRATKIYEMICNITGESKHAHRTVRKPIQFQGTNYPEFNKTIQTFVNRTNSFPDYFDVLKCLDHCNKQYSLGILPNERSKIAQDAFIKIGKQLQKRRKADLYETVCDFGGIDEDPALEDSTLLEKLNENKKHYSKISDIIDKYARKQIGDPDSDSNSSKLGEFSRTGTTPSSTIVRDPNSKESNQNEDDDVYENDDEENLDNNIESKLKENLEPEDFVISDDEILS